VWLGLARKIHGGGDNSFHGQIYFETTREVLCEDDGVEMERFDFNSDDSFGADRSKLFSPSAEPQLRELFGFDSYSNLKLANSVAGPKHSSTTLEWLDLVEMYSNCELMHESDKRMAIAGIAQKIHLRTETSYCAGIWSEGIGEDCLHPLTREHHRGHG
jgi:hypothetical protein